MKFAVEAVPGYIYGMEDLRNALTADLIDAAKRRMGLDTDYKLAKALKWSQNNLTNYRTRGGSMDLIRAYEFSEVTGITLEEIARAARNDRAARGVKNRRTVKRAA